MMSMEEISNISKQPWLPESRKPTIHTWLQPSMDEKTQERLKVAGNVVIPQMAWVAAHMLSKMATWNPLQDPDFDYWIKLLWLDMSRCCGSHSTNSALATALNPPWLQLMWIAKMRDFHGILFATYQQHIQIIASLGNVASLLPIPVWDLCSCVCISGPARAIRIVHLACLEVHLQCLGSSDLIWYLSGYLIWFKLYSIVNKQVGQLPCTDFNGLRNWKLGLMFHGGLISFIDFYVTAYDMLWCHIINKRGSFIPFQNQNTFRTDISFLASPWLPGSIGPAKDCDTRSFEFTQIYIKHSTKIFNYVWIILTFMPKIWNRKHRWISKVTVSCGIPPFVFWMFFSCGSPWLSLDVPLR